MATEEVEKWVDDEFEKWRKAPCYNPFGLDVDGDWRSKSFALWILKKYSSFTGKGKA